MQVLLAFAFDRQHDAAEAEGRLRRVAEHYQPLWGVPVERRGVDAGRLGLHLWDAKSSPWRWPSWQQDDQLAVATLYLPLGYERLIGDVEPTRAALPLAKALMDRPSAILDLTSPFVLASLAQDQGRLRLHADGLGIGRLYELRFHGGWVWSNRPAAACRFAGIPAEADRDGWRLFAASGWFLGDRTPFSRVFTVPGGTTIEYDAGLGRLNGRIDALAAWSADRPSDPSLHHRVNDVADALVGLFKSLGRMSPLPIVADLSGGRDSRLVVAAALASGLTVTLNTNGALPGEADIAERLVGALPLQAAQRVTHRINRPTVTGPGRNFGLDVKAPILPNALAWHRSQEGLRPSTYLPSAAPSRLAPPDHILVNGVAGEIAHGYYYPVDFAEVSLVESTERLDAFAGPLAERILLDSGISAIARAAATARIRQTLEQAFLSGLRDAKVLDYFYAAERLRRWGTTAERTGTITPLLVPQFLRAAFDLTPEERKESALHRATTALLMPEWKDEPYYKHPAGLVLPAFAARLGAAVDRDLISAIVAAPTLWADGYNPTSVAQSWRLLLDGRGRSGDERLLQRVIWRAVFADYLDEVNGEQGEARIPLEKSPLPPKPGVVVRGRRFAARGLRKAARTIEPPG